MKNIVKAAMIIGSIIFLVLISGCVYLGSGSKDVKGNPYNPIKGYILFDGQNPIHKTVYGVKEQYGKCSVIAMKTTTYAEKYVKDNMGAQRLESFKNDPSAAKSITYYFDGEDIHWIPFPDIEKDFFTNELKVPEGPFIGEIDPGEYIIIGATWDYGYTSGNTNYFYWNRSNLTGENMVFTVEPGEVVYVNDWVIDPFEGLKINIFDNYDVQVPKAKEKYPTFSAANFKNAFPAE